MIAVVELLDNASVLTNLVMLEHIEKKRKSAEKNYTARSHLSIQITLVQANLKQLTMLYLTELKMKMIVSLADVKNES